MCLTSRVSASVAIDDTSMNILESASAVVKPVICLGGTVWETIFNVDHIPGRGVKLLPKGARQLASGMAASAAATIARMKMPVELWSCVGDDPVGQQLRSELEREGICIDQLRAMPGVSTAISTILVDPCGERLIVPYFDPASPSDAAWLPLERVEHAAAVLVDVRWSEGAEALMTRARSEGVPTVLDADTAAPELLRRLMQLADHVLFSEPALESLDLGASVEARLLALRQSLPRAHVVGVTLGERGAALLERDSQAVCWYPAFRVTAVDTLNAGDVWHGAYVVGLIKGMGLSARVRLANMASAIKCERLWGRSGAPTWDEVQSRLALQHADDAVPSPLT